MRTVGQILRETREAKFYTLEEIEKATKIRKEFLQALESDNYTKLPPITFVQGFIKNYAKFLKLDERKLLAIFRRESPDKQNKNYVMDAFASPVKEAKFKITPGRVLGIVVFLIVSSFFSYLWLQYRQFVGAPNLQVITPVDQLTTDNPNLLVEGKTDPEIKVTVNSQEVTVDPNGDFKADINLSSPVNKIDVIAASKFGQKIQVERIVYLKR